MTDGNNEDQGQQATIQVMKVGRRPRSVWREKDSIEGRTVDALVVILDGPGCSYASIGGCTMCGYNSAPSSAIGQEGMLDQVRWVISNIGSEPYLKVFTSGSFLDQREVPRIAAKELLEGISSSAPGTRVLIESRPEFITDESIEFIMSAHDRIEVAIGLESSSDIVRGSLVQKGFLWTDFERAGRLLVESGLGLKTYLLLKPPFLGEYDAFLDVMTSIKEVSRSFPGSRISINPINIQSGTPLENIYYKGLYRPPWLWTVLRTLEEGKGIVPSGTHLMSCPTAGGRRRGAHNCGACDQTVLDVIGRFSLDNSSPLGVPETDCCRVEWENEMAVSGPFPMMT